MYKLTGSELLKLNFGDVIRVVWHNSRYHSLNESHYGVVFGHKIGWEDDLTDDLRTIAESAFADVCKVYLVSKWPHKNLL